MNIMSGDTHDSEAVDLSEFHYLLFLNYIRQHPEPEMEFKEAKIWTQAA